MLFLIAALIGLGISLFAARKSYNEIVANLVILGKEFCEKFPQVGKQRTVTVLSGSEIVLFLLIAIYCIMQPSLDSAVIAAWCILGVWFLTLLVLLALRGVLVGLEPSFSLHALLKLNTEKSRKALKNLEDKLAFQQLKEAHSIAMSLPALHTTLKRAQPTIGASKAAIEQIQSIRKQIALFSSCVWAVKDSGFKTDEGLLVLKSLTALATQVDSVYVPKDPVYGQVYYSLTHANAEDVIQNLNQTPGSLETLFTNTLDMLVMFKLFAKISAASEYERVLASMAIKLNDS